MHARLLSLLALLWCGSCILSESSPGVMIATDPPGARVLVDGIDSGFATPASIDLSDRDVTVSVELEGYQTATRELTGDRRWHVVPWSDGDISTSTWRFPLFLTFAGLFFPFRFRENSFPKRIYIPLEVAVDG